MAVTHADLAQTARRGTDIGSKTSMVLMVISILLGLLCFVLCLIAEATRSQIVGGDGDGESCRYSGNGKTALICGGGAFFSLVIAMVVQHTHLLLSVSKSDPDPMDQYHLNTLTWQAAFFFITTWICFCVGEVLLLIGVSVESGHMRPRCLVAPEGLFCAAGVLGITTVFLASGLSITALRLLQDQQQQQQQQNVVIMAEAFPSYSRSSLVDTTRHQVYHEPGLIDYLRAFDKII